MATLSNKSITYGMLSSYNTKAKEYNDNRFVSQVSYNSKMEQIENKLNDFETEPIDFDTDWN